MKCKMPSSIQLCSQVSTGFLFLSLNQLDVQRLQKSGLFRSIHVCYTVRLTQRNITQIKCKFRYQDLVVEPLTHILKFQSKTPIKSWQKCFNSGQIQFLQIFFVEKLETGRRRGENVKSYATVVSRFLQHTYTHIKLVQLSQRKLDTLHLKQQKLYFFSHAELPTVRQSYLHISLLLQKCSISIVLSLKFLNREIIKIYDIPSFTRRGQHRDEMTATLRSRSQ